MDILEKVAQEFEAYGKPTYNTSKSMVIEIESLRAQLKAAQEPIYLWRLEDDGWMECTKEWFDGPMSQEYEKRIVYAAPIPAQQSPAVAVPELRKCCGNPVMDNGYVCCGDYLYGDDATEQSPRITEQDAREIAQAFEDFADEGETAHSQQHWTQFLHWSGRALLDKLNQKGE